MAETIRNGKWLWYDVMNDLEKQGGLTGVVIEPTSVGPYGCGGNTKKGTGFYITWIADTFLLVSMSQEEQELIDAFAKIVEYAPFCRYSKDGMLTFEWDKQDPEGRFKDLAEEAELKRI